MALGGTGSLDEYCGSPFWNSTRTWYTDNPDFTICFEKTILVWTPCAFMFISWPFELYYILKSKDKDIPCNWLNTSKLVTVLLLLELTVADMIYAAGSGMTVNSVDLSTPLLKLTAFLWSAVLQIGGRKNGRRSSGVIFLFWLFLLVCAIPQYRTELNYELNKDQHNKQFTFISYMLYVPLITVMFILNCFSDAEPRHIHYRPSGIKCPEPGASFVSKVFFCYYDSFAWLGYQNQLEFKDIWSLRPEDTAHENGSTLLRHWKANVRRLRARWSAGTSGETSEARPDQPKASILPALAKSFGLTFFSGAVLRLLADLLTFANPQMLKLLISFVKSDSEPVWRGFLYAVGMFVSAMLHTLFYSHYEQKMYVLGNRVRTALVCVIYKKALRLSNSARRETTVGEISNLMSVDAERFDDVASYLNLIWSAPLVMALSMYFLWDVLGPSALAGLVVMVVLLPINGVLANKMEKLRTQEMELKDERAKVVNEMLSGIKAIKLYAWEPPFVRKIAGIRNKEIGVLVKGAYLSGVDCFLWECTPFMVALVSFATYVLVDKNNVLDTEKAFVGLALFNILRMPLSAIPMLLSTLIQAAVSTKRINKFLNSEDLDPSNVLHNTRVEAAIEIKDGTFAWTRGELPNLNEINLEVKRGTLIAVVGHVGSGKSSLISAILGEMYKITGRVNTKGSVAYVPQQAWIQNASLKDNILFARALDPELYSAVVEGCALKSDFDMLPGGDKTEIGEKGINLSGGQKQRVSLARAVYSDADTYLLDDPLSAVDSHVGKHIFDNVIGPDGLLKEKTRIFVTHGVALLPQADLIVVMKDGQVHETGTYGELLMKNDLFSSFVHLQAVSPSKDNEETLADLKSGEGVLDEFGEVRLTNVLSATQNHEEGRSAYETSTGLLTRKGSRSSILRRNVSIEQNVNPAGVPVGTNLIDDEAMETGSVKWKVYSTYFKSIGLVCSVATLAANLLYQGFSVGSNAWLSVWSSDNGTSHLSAGSEYPGKLYMYLGVYGALGFGQAVGMVLGSSVPLIGCVRASKIMHQALLDGVMRAPLKFFDTTPVGRLLARFGKDVAVLDNEIPPCIMGALVILFEVMASLLIISYTTPSYIAVIIPIAVLYCFLQRFYVRTARQVKRLVSVSRSPVFSHFSETIMGASSIRAYAETDRFINEAEQKFDLNQACNYTSLVADRWLALRLEIIGNFIVFFAAIFAVLGRASNIAPGLVGLSISYALQITPFLNWLMRLAAEVETDIVAVERIKEYSETSKEAEWQNEYFVDPAWPQHGAITFTNYQLRYREGLDLVLKDATFTIIGGEKVGIVGRTGAGKSSLTLSLFRIIEGAGGSITIDGVDISKLGLHALRSRLTIIPQDPVLFTGSVRFNLDPFDQHTDEEVWRALDHSHLKAFVEGLALGLHHEVTEGGENFSVGQRQLICLARALLRKTKVLILDEATASVDLETDDLIQRTIRTEFEECTVLTIAHRLNTIMDSDRVLVLDKGRVTEFDSPASLLKTPNSTFYGMSKDAGLILCPLE